MKYIIAIIAVSAIPVLAHDSKGQPNKKPWMAFSGFADQDDVSMEIASAFQGFDLIPSLDGDVRRYKEKIEKHIGESSYIISPELIHLGKTNRLFIHIYPGDKLLQDIRDDRLTPEYFNISFNDGATPMDWLKEIAAELLRFQRGVSMELPQKALFIKINLNSESEVLKEIKFSNSNAVRKELINALSSHKDLQTTHIFYLTDFDADNYSYLEHQIEKMNNSKIQISPYLQLPGKQADEIDPIVCIGTEFRKRLGNEYRDSVVKRMRANKLIP